MNFYDIIQKDPILIKQLINESESKKEINKLRLGIFARSLLILLFAIILISSLSSLFGSQNSSMAVVIFCLLLGVRFVDFGYCIKDSIINLTIVFLILLISPVVSYYSDPFLGLIINFLSLLIILFITCDKPEMGNGGLYSFAYIFLLGNPVTGDVFFNRFLLMCVGVIICSVIFFIKHKDKNKDVTFRSKIQKFSLYNHKYKWEIRMSLGISLILFIGSSIQLDRVMWVGFACSSLLCDYSKTPKIHERFFHRILGVISGCILFYIVYSIIPNSLHIIIGPLSGFCLGFCTDYRYKTAVNCFGALMTAAGIYGIHSAIMLRIINTLIGVVFAVFFYYFYEIVIKKIQNNGIQNS